MRWLFIPLLLIASSALAENPAPEVDTAEALRRGDSVTVMGEGPRSDEDEAFNKAMAPPDDDNHRWMLLSIGMKNPPCEACNKLKADFRKAPELLAFITAPDEAKAWAHFDEYLVEDTTQREKLKRYRISSVPVVVLQVPENGCWGPPGTIVYQSKPGYDGNPKKLATEIREAVRRYTRQAVKHGYNGHPKVSLAPLTPAEYYFASAGGARQYSPPFPQETPYQYDPNAPQQIPPQYQPQPNQNPPSPTPSPGGDFLVKLGVWMTALSAMALVVLRILERIAPITPTKVDDLVVTLLSRLRDLGLLGPVQPPAPTPNPYVPVAPQTNQVR